MEAAAAAMLEAGVGRFSRAPALAAALLAEMWAPLAVALAALATLPSLLRRLQVIVLRLRSRGKEVIQSHIGTYYSSCDEDDDEEEEEEESSDEADTTSSSGEEEQDLKRIGFYEGAAVDSGFPWGGAVVRTWQGLPRAFSCAGGGSARPGPLGGVPAVRLWGAMTASGGEPWWACADEGGCRDGAAAEASSASSDQVVVGWRREHAASRRRRRAPLPHVRTN
ncbi:hypothetical protein PAHAL_2G222600 [Panicum hallii]|jgi:hypothetical protein|uniref:Uncharacterized protein n=1 Tax=Panicum hallii TaxID=206008 RepID=A0A2S3GZ52_9POAL|nr:uncharacterized protein LOC112883616 [Panicum hallii]PAN11855.1 hypothetical protein PAHAL_2G222600 [Panicum hallii]